MDASARYEQRKTAIHLLRSGVAANEVAQRLGRSLSWVYKWKARFEQNPNFNCLKDRSRAPRHCPNRLPEAVQQAIKKARSELEAEAADGSGLIYLGAQALQARLQDQGVRPLPSITSIERTLRRAGMTRPRSAVAEAVTYPRLQPQLPHGLCQVDIVPHHLKDGPKVASFNAIDVVSGYATGQSYLHKRAQDACDFLLHLWHEQGIARYTQTDNEACFCGGFTHKYVLGQVLRLCLYVGTELVFSPHYHPKSNGHVERFHQDYNKHVWRRGRLTDLEAVNAASKDFFAAYRCSRHQRRLRGKSPASVHRQQAWCLVPAGFKRPTGRLPLTEGRVHFMRKVTEAGTISVLNVDWPVPAAEAEQGVWATLELSQHAAQLRIFDAAPDAAHRRCLGQHRFPLKEPVQPLRPEFQRAGRTRFSISGLAETLYRVVFRSAAVWLFSTMS